MTHVLAQEQTPACGEAPDVDWLCTQVLEATGNEFLARLAVVVSTFGRILLIVVVAYLATRVARRVTSRFAGRMEQRIETRLQRSLERGAITDTQRFRGRRLQRLHAITGVLRGVIGTVIWTTALLVILSEFGVALQPILAGAGLAGIVIGFGAQQLVRDVLAGIAMLIEDQYGVGDWIEVEGKFGQVERVGLRSTAFRDVDGVVHHVLNGAIQRVGNLSQEWARATFDVPVALDADIPAAKALIHKVATDLATDPLWGEDIIGAPELWGVQEFGPQGIKIRVVIPTKPLRNWDVTRQLRERLKLAFEQAGIRMPTHLIDVGGQRFSYPLLTQAAPPPARHEPHRRGLVPPDVTPLDRPPVTQDRQQERPPPTAADRAPTGTEAELGAEPHPEPEPGAQPRPETEPRPEAAPRPAAEEPATDATAELRLQQGPQPRPD